MNENKRGRIAARAYRIWESEDRPTGKESEHWRRAEQEIARQDAAPQMGTEAASPGRPENAPSEARDSRPAPPIAAAPPLKGTEKRAAPSEKQPRRGTGRTGTPKGPPQQG